MATTLPTHPLGRTGLQVTRLGFGAMELRGPRIWGGRPVTDEQAESLLNAVLDAGINLLDTSPDYGLSEEYIGRYLAHRRSEYYLVTKCGCNVTRRDTDTDDTPHLWTRENLFRNLEESLRRMKTEYVDVMLLHNPTVTQVLEGDLEQALRDMRRQGKVRWIGVAATTPHLERFVGWHAFDAVELPYSALQREYEQWISEMARQGVATIIRSGVAKGEPGMGLGQPERWRRFEQANLDELREPGESRTQFLLRFGLNHPQIDMMVIGTLNPDHLRENVAAIQHGPLPDEVYNEACRRLDAVGYKALGVAR